jgi:uncharacterized protein YbcI
LDTLQGVIARGALPHLLTDGADGTPPSIGRLGHELEELTTALVCLHKKLFGLGPTKARSGYSGPDTVVATLENGLTTAERNLIAAGEQRAVWESRMVLLQANERLFAETVERITGRSVRAFISGLDVQKDVSTAVFCFEPGACAEAPKRGGS